MPYKTHRSVFKRMRQNAKHRERNRVIRGTMRAILRAIRTQKNIKDVLDKLAWKISGENDSDLLKQAGAKMYSAIDKALKKGVIHANKAARHKSQISQWMNQIS